MDLTQRQKKILQAVVDCYVATAEPVGSKTIAAMPDMGYSSATIRNELATLTEQGLWNSPTPQRAAFLPRRATGSISTSSWTATG